MLPLNESLKRSHSPRCFISLSSEIPLTVESTCDACYDDDLRDIISLFPDCDVEFISMKLRSYESTDRKSQIVDFLLNNSYPKSAKSETKSADLYKRAALELLTANDVIEKFIDPHTYFHRKNRNVDGTYRDHVFVYLANALPKASRSHIKRIMKENSNLLLQTLDAVKEQLDFVYCASWYDYGLNSICKDEQLERKAKRIKLEKELSKHEVSQVSLNYSDPPSEYFYYELAFIQYNTEIEDILRQKENLRIHMKTKFSDILLECSICLLADCLPEEMHTCNSCKRTCCKSCLRSYIETRAESGDINFHCIFNDCTDRLTENIISCFIPQSSFIFRQLQLRDIQEANIENLESCPHCGYAMIIDNENMRVFSCKNPSCMKETCRLCNESNHLPLRCDEVEKDRDKDFRVFIEKRVSESIIRRCPKCRTRFYKLDGCDLITCNCGQLMCYQCRQAVVGYDHFTNSISCRSELDTRTLHLAEMKLAYEQAVKEYTEKHPDYECTLSFEIISQDMNI